MDRMQHTLFLEGLMGPMRSHPNSHPSFILTLCDSDIIAIIRNDTAMHFPSQMLGKIQ